MKSQYVKQTLVLQDREIRTIGINDVNYVSARGTTDVFGLDWRTQKRQLLESDSVILYGVIDISAPEFAGFSEQRLTIGSKNGAENADILSQGSGYRADRDDSIFIRMDRAMMFIARVSTSQMRANGNHEGAEIVLAKQIEFSQALHDYETIGIAINSNHFGADEMRRKQRLTVAKLIQIKTTTSDLADRRVLSQLIGNAASEIGATYQPDLIDQQ